MRHTPRDSSAAHGDRTITADDLLGMGDIGRCELLEGRIVMMSPAGRRHGRVCLKVGRLVGSHADAHALGEATSNDTGFIIARDPDTVRAPDVAFVAASRLTADIPEQKFYPFAPDLAVEVVSPDDTWSEVVAKARMWIRAGTRLVWIVDPQTRTVHVWTPGPRTAALGEADELEGADVLPGFRVRVAELFS